jgi:hypothetical protein
VVFSRQGNPPASLVVTRPETGRRSGPLEPDESREEGAMQGLKWMLMLVLAAGLVLGAASTAMAQEEEGESETVYKKTTIIDFSDVQITGELTKPEGSYLMNKKKANFDLLIKTRGNFLPEMLDTVDHL